MAQFSDIPKFILDEFFNYFINKAVIPGAVIDPTLHSYLRGPGTMLRTSPFIPFTLVGPETGIILESEVAQDRFYLIVEKFIDENINTDRTIADPETGALYKIPFYPVNDSFEEDYYFIQRLTSLETADTSGVEIDSGSRVWFLKTDEPTNFIDEELTYHYMNNLETFPYPLAGTEVYKDRFVNTNKRLLYFGKIYNSGEDVYRVKH